MDRPPRSNSGGGGGDEHSGGTASTVSKEDALVLSCEVSSSLPEVELGLGLSLGSAAGAPSAAGGAKYPRILTAKDFSSSGVPSSSFSASLNSLPKLNNSASCGSKRSADSSSSPRSGPSQVVGWPPVRANRMNSLINRSKSPVSDDPNSPFARSKTNTIVPDKADVRKDDDPAKGPKNSSFVKVNMDGMPIGRKIDLKAHAYYETFTHALDDMFCEPRTTISARSSNLEDGGVVDPTESLRLLDESSEYVLTYEDKDGDWMLVGDVPWEMFIDSVKRLRIMRRSEANGLAPTFRDRNIERRSKRI